MTFKNIHLLKNTVFYEKLNNAYTYNKSNIIINKLVVTIKLPSNIKYINGFITMLILLEKNTNNVPIFLKDINTLSRGRFIKIGLFISLKNELMEQYLQLCMIHSIPKINKENITFNIAIKNYNFFYNTNIILSNTIFSFDTEIFQYYSYLNELSYNIEFIFYINTKNLLINKFLISTYNIDVIIEDKNAIEYLNEVTENNIMLELGDEEYSELDIIEESVEDESDLEERNIQHILEFILNNE
jgi:hypothetical protein